LVAIGSLVKKDIVFKQGDDYAYRRETNASMLAK
jgi:hypothetical protein